ncbi:MAG: DUF6498-containing protein [Patescibacteria group bacterium]|jgi:hypothetical protein
MSLPSWLKQWSVVALIVANLIPLAGVLWWDWSLFQIMFLYWAESAVIGLYNIFKLIVLGRWIGLAMAIFFIFHLGVFMIVHLMFIVAFFLVKDAVDPMAIQAEVVGVGKSLAISGLALLISHGISFWQNFVSGGEAHKLTINDLMLGNVYGRIIVMQLTLIFGAFLSLQLGNPIWALAVLILLKTVTDLAAHLHEHRYFSVSFK